VETEYDEARFRNEIAEALTGDSAIRMIDFYIGTGERLHVTGAGIRQIGALIRSGSIKIVVDDARLNASGAGAEYKNQLNTLFVRTEWVRTKKELEKAKIEQQRDLENYLKWSPDPQPKPGGSDPSVFRSDSRRRGNLVHEATHALLDLRGFKVYRARNEVAAFLAMMVYLLHKRELESLLLGVFQKPTGLEKRADEVAREKGLYTKLGVRLTRADLQPLLRGVFKEYGDDAFGRTPADGID